MYYKKVLFAAFLVGLLAIPLAGVQAAARFESSEKGQVTISDESEGDLFASGEEVKLTGQISGELFTAGGSVTVDTYPARSVFAAGRDVFIKDGAGHNVFAAGLNVEIDGEVGNDVYAAGSSVIFKEGAVITGSVRIAAATVVLNGSIDGDVYVVANEITSRADIGGSLTADTGPEVGGKLSIPEGSIAGDVKYTSKNELSRGSDVEIGGSVEQTVPKSITFAERLLGIFLSILSAVAVAAVVVVATAKRAGRVFSQMERSYGQAMGFGALALILTPVLAIVFLVTVVLAPLGLILLALWLVLLLVSFVYGATFFARWILGLLGRQLHGNERWVLVGYAAIGAGVLALIETVPQLTIITVISFIALALPALGALVSDSIQQEQ
jgi:cytoskeletal protein CcmA (bactofilin family)